MPSRWRVQGHDLARRAGAPKRKSHTKRRSGLVQALKNRPGEPVGVTVRNGDGRPNKKRVARRPNLHKFGIDRSNDLVGVQNLRKGTRVNVDEQTSDDKAGRLGVRSRRAVWMDGPTLRAFVFGDTE
jgi:hypothetical protein